MVGSKFDIIIYVLTLASMQGTVAVVHAFGFSSQKFASSTASRRTLRFSSQLYMKYKKVFVAGGSRGVGRHIVDKLVANGSEVVALVRDDSSVKELASIDGVSAIQGDAFDYKAVEGAMDGCDAAITTLGKGNVAPGEKRVDYEGNSNVIEAAGILGVTRLILVTSVGCGSSKQAVPESVLEVLKDTLAAKERAENLLIKYYTNMNWTIIRPAGLKSEPATGNAVLTEDCMAVGVIHREDVADLVVRTLESAAAERKVLTAVDPTIDSALNADGRKVDEFVLA
jgi:nucleoside-diphosphate-sugar epimerase